MARAEVDRRGHPAALATPQPGERTGERPGAVPLRYPTDGQDHDAFAARDSSLHAAQSERRWLGRNGGGCAAAAFWRKEHTASTTPAARHRSGCDHSGKGRRPRSRFVAALWAGLRAGLLPRRKTSIHRGLRMETGGGSGIRTHGTRERTHAFQACALSRSAIPPADPPDHSRAGGNTPTPVRGSVALDFGPPRPYLPGQARTSASARPGERNTAMAWTRPTIREICIGMEINGYLPAEI